MLRTQISLTEEERRLLDVEAARTGLSISALIRRAVSQTYRSDRDIDEDLKSIDAAFGSWAGRNVDGESYVEQLRSGDRLLSRERLPFAEGFSEAASR